MVANAELEPDGESRARVFISYSRKDMPFANRLDAALRARGFEPLIDRADIYAFEDWWERIKALIGQSDTVIFVLSPDAVGSDICAKEVAFAASLNKRFAPIIFRRVDDARIPEPLARLHFIFFDDETQFDAGMERLGDALSTDIEWIRKHTEFGEMARRWSQAGQPGPRGLLLRSPALEQAEKWIASRPAGAPPPTEDVQALITESRRATTQRRQFVSMVLAAGLAMTLGLAVVAYWQRGIAVEQRDLAVAAQLKGIAGRALSLAETDTGTALALALEAVPQTSSWNSVPYVSEAERALATAAYEHREVRILAESPHFNNSIDEARTNGNWVIQAVFSPDGNRALTLSADAKVRLWEAASGHLLPGLEHQLDVDDRVVGGKLIVTPDGRRVVAQIWTNLKVYSPRLWNLETRQRLAVLGDDKVPTTDLAVSPDGRLIAVSKADGTLRLWSPDTGDEAGVVRGENKDISAVAFSPDSRSIAFCDGKRLRIIEAATRQERVAVDAGDNKDGSCLPVFSPDGKLLATTSSTGVTVWDAADGAQVAKVGEADGPAQRIAFSPDSQSFVVLQGEKPTWFDARKGTSKWVLDIYDDSVRSAQGERRLSSVAFNRDGTALVVGSHDGTATLWAIDAASGSARKIARLKGHQSRVVDAAFSPDGKTVVTASLDATARIWDANVQPRFKVHFPGGTSAIITPDGEQLMIGTQAAVSMFDVATRKKTDELRNFALLRWLAQSPDGKKLAIPLAGNTVLVVGDQPEGTQCELKGHTDVISDGTFGADASRLWTSSYDGTVRVWDVAACKAQAVLWRGKGKYRTLRVSPDGRLVAVNESGAAAVEIVDALSGQMIHEIGSDRGQVAFLGFSPDSRYVVTIPVGGPVHVWEASTGAHVRALPHDADMAVWSRDGSRIVTGNLLQPGKLWDAQSGALIRTLGGHVFGTDAAAFSPDSRHLVTASKGGFKLVAGPVFIWDARTGDQLATLFGADRGIDSIQYSTDGAHILTQGEQSDTILWGYFPHLNDLVDYALRAASRCLTLEQREALFLRPEPPGWCIEMEKWPYQSQDWKDWLKFKRANADPPLPNTAAWKSWIAAHR